MPRALRLLSSLTLAFVFGIIALSSYIRLSHAGLGCEPWPACYGLIGELSESAKYGAADPSLFGIQLLHRVLAGGLGLTVLAMTWLAWLHREAWPGGMGALSKSLLLLALTVFLAVLGLQSGQLHARGLVMGNIAGGFFMLGIAGWLRFAGTAERMDRPGLKVAAILGVLLLAGQIWLGGLTSANFAAGVCDGFPACQGRWIPGADLFDAMDLGRELTVDDYGRAEGGAERVAVNLAHRWGALLTLVWLAGVAFAAWRLLPKLKSWAIALGALAIVQFATGVTMAFAALPAWIVASHNWLAGILLLLLIRIALSARQPSSA